MKFAIIGGTHGNEPVGIEVIKSLGDKYKHEHQTILANEEAYRNKTRYIDSDLNRSYGELGQSLGYEKKRSKEISEQVESKFDFIIDLHTTTSNMGLTLILTSLDDISLKAACFLSSQIPELIIIISSRAGLNCPYTSSLAQSSLIIEVGPVANNVLCADLIIKTKMMVELILNYDFNEDFDYEKVQCFHTLDILKYPEEGNWYVHPKVDKADFKLLSRDTEVFINAFGETKTAQLERDCYPLFINEAAYQESGIAMELSYKKNLSDLLK
jgi:succinylglutamate desuccinylase